LSVGLSFLHRAAQVPSVLEQLAPCAGWEMLTANPAIKIAVTMNPEIDLNIVAPKVFDLKYSAFL